jgi:predicted ABC-type ATPase
MPNLFVVAGPNGAGKSTSAPELLSGVRQVAEFVNADVIQKERVASEIEAGRITLARLTTLAVAPRASPAAGITSPKTPSGEGTSAVSKTSSTTTWLRPIPGY